MTQVLHSAYHFLGDIIPLTVTTKIEKGIGIHVIGIPDSQVKETLLRVVTAIQSVGYHIPGKKIVIEIEPHGGNGMWAGAFRPAECCQAFDVAIALGILMASEQIKPLRGKEVDQVLFFGRLTYEGCLIAPAQGFGSNHDAALVIEYQLRRNWDKIYGYPVSGSRSIWSPIETLVDLIKDLTPEQ